MLHNLIKHQQLDIDKIYLKFISVKDPFESKYQLLINKTEQVEIKKPLLTICKQMMMPIKTCKTVIKQ